MQTQRLDELQRRIEKSGYNLKAVAAHPGLTNTNLGQFLTFFGVSIFGAFTSLFGQNAKAGALPTLRAALDPAVKGGEYFGPSGFREFTGQPVEVSSSTRSLDLLLASKLWLASEEMTGEKFEI